MDFGFFLGFFGFWVPSELVGFRVCFLVPLRVLGGSRPLFGNFGFLGFWWVYLICGFGCWVWCCGGFGVGLVGRALRFVLLAFVGLVCCEFRVCLVGCCKFVWFLVMFVVGFGVSACGVLLVLV